MGLNKSKNLTAAKKTCDQWFSKYIRIRDANTNGLCKCITCDTVKHWKDMDAGHFQSRRYNITRWDVHNAHAQCQKCNQYGAGEQYKHGKEIDLRYGKGTAEYLSTLTQSLYKINKSEVMTIAREFKKEAERLAKIKGIEI